MRSKVIPRHPGIERNRSTLNKATNIVTLSTLRFMPSLRWDKINPMHLFFRVGRKRSLGYVRGDDTAAPSRPSRVAFSRIAWMQKAMWASRSTFNSWAPCNDVFAMYTTRESLVFHLLTDAGNIYIEDRSGGLDQGHSGEKTGEFIAGEKGLGEMRGSGHAGVLCMAHDRLANLLRPSLLARILFPTKGCSSALGYFS